LKIHDLPVAAYKFKEDFIEQVGAKLKSLSVFTKPKPDYA